MDQIDKIYEELIQFDPSLWNNKEAVLQMIKKMIAAKPNITVNQAWKEGFAEKLSEHIMQDKNFIPRKDSLFSRATKWSISLSTFFIAVVVVGAGYRGIYVHKKESEKVVVPNMVQEYAVMDSSVEVDSNVSVETMVAATITEDSVKGVSENLQVAADQNIAADSVVEVTKDLPLAKMSTQVDNQTSWETMALAGVKQEEEWMLAMPPVANSSLAPDQRKTVALLFVDDQWKALQSVAASLMQDSSLAATFVESNSWVRAALQNMGYETLENVWMNAYSSYTELSLSTENSVHASLSDRSIIVMCIDELIKHPQLLKKLVAKLQAEGYVFVHLSAMRR